MSTQHGRPAGSAAIEMDDGELDVGDLLGQQGGDVIVAQDTGVVVRIFPGLAFASTTRSFKVLYGLFAFTARIPGSLSWRARSSKLLRRRPPSDPD